MKLIFRNVQTAGCPVIQVSIFGGVVDEPKQTRRFLVKKEPFCEKSGENPSKAMLRKEIPSLEDAHDAGTNNGHSCTLILCVGTTGKRLACGNLLVNGWGKYGAYPFLFEFTIPELKGGFEEDMVVYDQMENLIKILGLKVKKKYNTLEDNI
ncbi:hypothetical protein DMENIID0001_151820 [Sergentomyia squamirostris]